MSIIIKWFKKDNKMDKNCWPNDPVQDKIVQNGIIQMQFPKAKINVIVL